MILFVFIHSMVGKVYKILPLKEEHDAGEDTHIAEYIDSLCTDAVGAFETFNELKAMASYITIVNTLQYLNTNDFDHVVCKREVFKMIRLLQQIEREIGGDYHDV